jgi:lactoylglutathione lyase
LAIGWMPAASLFFHDPDGHLLEYLAMLPHVSRAEAGVVPQSEWMTAWAQGAD